MEPWVEKRLERLQNDGVPVTVWHVECLGKADPESPAFSTFTSKGFDTLRIFGPLSMEDPTMPGFFADECRACTGRFVFRTRNDLTATILTGNPNDGVRYDAISYVWGDTRPLRIYCRCGSKLAVPISSSERFCNLLCLAGMANHCDGVWLDALSINQDSDEDKKKLIAVMGDIYKNAEAVLVLLPEADQLLLDHLLDLRRNVLLQDEMGLLDSEKIKSETFNDSHGIEIDAFIGKLREFRYGLDRSVYFRRAWTFQEWALARDVNVACENAQSNQNWLKLVPQVKSCVIRATIRLVMHQRHFRDRSVPFKTRVADLPALVDEVKSIFPHEDVFCSSEEVDWEERIRDINFPTTGMNHMLGLRLVDDKLSPEQRLRARLHLMLNAFNLTERRARFQADIVACWASMCNLPYEYNKDDDVLTALRKAIHAIRAQGVQVYNFQASIKGSSADSDLPSFHTYATEQPMKTSTAHTFTIGAPAFTGFADLVQHLITSLDDYPENTRPGDKFVPFGGLGVPLRKVVGATIETITPAENTELVSDELARIQTGYWDPGINLARLFWNVKDVVLANLQRTDRSILQEFCLVVVSFVDANLFLKHEFQDDTLEEATGHLQSLNIAAPLDGNNSVPSGSTFTLSKDVEVLKYAWTVCPKVFLNQHLSIAREGINGTLVLARTVKGVTSVLAYLAGVDHMSGAYLLPTSEGGTTKLTLRAPQRADIVIAAKGRIYANRDRLLVAQVELEDVEVLGF